MKPGTPWSRKLVNEQVQRIVAEVLAQLTQGQTAKSPSAVASAASAAKG